MIGQSRMTSIGETVITASSKKENKMSYFVREEKKSGFCICLTNEVPKTVSAGHWWVSHCVQILIIIYEGFHKKLQAWRVWRFPSQLGNLMLRLKHVIYCTLVFIWFSRLKVSLEVISFYCRMTASQTMKRDCLWENPDLLWVDADISFF